MEPMIQDFVKEMFAMSNMPHHEFTVPCDHYDWLDLGLRTRLLGISTDQLNPLLNKRFQELSSHVILYCTDIFQFHYIFMRSPDCDKIYCIGPVTYERFDSSFFSGLFASLHIPEKLHEPIRAHYSSVKYLPYLCILLLF